MNSWDPIGVSGTPQAHDEYDHYAIDVTSMILNQRTSDEVADYLHRIANDWIGLSVERQRSASVATRLIDAYSSIRNSQGLN
jgi:hypothetical protein